jgi:hypothetical protein
MSVGVILLFVLRRLVVGVRRFLSRNVAFLPRPWLVGGIMAVSISDLCGHFEMERTLSHATCWEVLNPAWEGICACGFGLAMGICAVLYLRSWSKIFPDCARHSHHFISIITHRITPQQPSRPLQALCGMLAKPSISLVVLVCFTSTQYCTPSCTDPPSSYLTRWSPSVGMPAEGRSPIAMLIVGRVEPQRANGIR